MSDSAEGELVLGNEYLRVRPNKGCTACFDSPSVVEQRANANQTEILRGRSKLGAEAPCYRPVKSG